MKVYALYTAGQSIHFLQTTTRGFTVPVELYIDVQSSLQLREDGHGILNVVLQVCLLPIRETTVLVQLQQVCAKQVRQVGGANCRLARGDLDAAIQDQQVAQGKQWTWAILILQGKVHGMRTFESVSYVETQRVFLI